MAAPTIYRSPISGPLTIKYGEKLEIAVTISGKPTPNVSWFINGRPVLPSGDVTLLVQHKKYSLRIERVQDDVKSVIVEATNELGSDRRIFNITVYKVLSGLHQDHTDSIVTDRTEGINVYYHRPRLQLAPVASISSLSLSSESDADEQTDKDCDVGQCIAETQVKKTVNFTIGDGPSRPPCSHSSSFDDSGFTDSGEFVTAFDLPITESGISRECHQMAASDIRTTENNITHKHRQNSDVLYDDNGYFGSSAYDTEVAYVNGHVTAKELEHRESAENADMLKPENNNDVTMAKPYSERGCEAEGEDRSVYSDDNIKFNLTTEYYSSPCSREGEGVETYAAAPRKYPVRTVRRRVIAMKDGKDTSSFDKPADLEQSCVKRDSQLSQNSHNPFKRKIMESKSIKPDDQTDDVVDRHEASSDTPLQNVTIVAATKRTKGCVYLVALGVGVPLALVIIGVSVWLFAFNGLDLVKEFVQDPDNKQPSDSVQRT